MARLTHRVFDYASRAHYAQRLFYCESSLRHWLRGTYWGWPQMNYDARVSYGGHWRDGWSRIEQVRSFKRMYLATLGVRDPWPNC